jgi:hypothetical protein
MTEDISVVPARKFRILPRLRKGSFPQNPFQIIIQESSYHPTPFNLDTGSVAK